MMKNLFLFLLRGGKYHCNICGSNWLFLNKVGVSSDATKKNKIIGAGIRFTRCWECGSVERERLLMNFLDTITNPTSLRVLHVAPEIQIQKKIQKKFAEYITCDLEKKEGIDMAVDITNMKNFSSCEFDILICNHVLEHIIDDQNAIKEINRVLKIRGIAILNVPIFKDLEKTYFDMSIKDPELRSSHFGQFDHVRIYGQDFFKKVERYGFRQKLINYPQLNKKLKLDPDEHVFQFIKQKNI